MANTNKIVTASLARNFFGSSLLSTLSEGVRLGYSILARALIIIIIRINDRAKTN